MVKFIGFAVENTESNLSYINKIDLSMFYDEIIDKKIKLFPNTIVYGIWGKKRLSIFTRAGLILTPIIMFIKFLIGFTGALNVLANIITSIWLGEIVIEYLLIKLDFWIYAMLWYGFGVKAHYNGKKKKLSKIDADNCFKNNVEPSLK